MPVFAYFGPAGTFTEMALEQVLAQAATPGESTAPLFLPAAERIAAPSPAAAIAMVRTGEVDYACVPIESSLEGSVPATMDALVPGPGAGRVQVFAETVIDVAFTIGAAAPIPPAQVTRLAAYPVAEAQVRGSVARLFPNAHFVTAASNAAAAHDVAAGDADAAVTTALAARLSGLTVLADGISDATDAVTRFLIIGRPAPPPAPTGADRTAVILELPNAPGSLMAAMNEFASRGVDLTRIESRPRRELERGLSNAGEYRFFLDAVGHIDDDAVAEALAALHRRCDRIVYLGSWPAHRVPGAVPPDHSASTAWVQTMRRGGDATTGADR
ncbi:Prephenate dehydratase [Gordonia bronchialis DSM 43247]|uniref:Prephenate dehydratase n=1 Tax=Gordonia bronchialis (strain ATCC 25592 / DSM 43247 / BCRC 13721 / JCM 3198 / KCTC 3076 / NBRC 16047 / NCTC 10667) TaxID=526226 RepID=D0LB92_GORB4|nr:prephenate dehydratase [Gordonia bronchialis]ACY19523.1 Prephenate dehydratase [Gordonia bronchialis DSM 43247]MCC3322303.1 prephenate dehydratase [Gordonia bronchialis]QGS26552.1 prephenate dehydratase [Gordonia bronchialis]UAK37075.1 prephenate dehydratase [Gordonia bronchialis]STQ62281.1 Prephenate dehydratase [Gordonia bronchialis]